MLNILKAEISRFARDDHETVTPRSVSDEGSPPPVVTPKCRSEGSPLFSGGGELTLLQLHPRRNRVDSSLRSGWLGGSSRGA